MSVQLNHYIVLGTVLPFDWYNSKDEDPDWEKVFDERRDSAFRGIESDKLKIFIDGMNGEYVVIGRVLVKTHYETGVPEFAEGRPVLASSIADIGPIDVVDVLKVEKELITEFGLTAREARVRLLWLSHWR